MPSYEELRGEKATLDELLSLHRAKLATCETDVSTYKKLKEEALGRIKSAILQQKALLLSPVISLSTYATTVRILKLCKDQVSSRKRDLDQANLLREQVRREIGRCEALLRGIMEQLDDFGKVYPLQQDTP